ncbi:hypothetical protein [Kitasatospora sp. NBC_01266]|uniref:hypothetical protein n=1 Tax=Kitasatospora sp. NBC_01266 TaxID=2903572 RepID=UPI002E379259|nr:hypothetical protein [Kitasatospora sp. NBC_01266]
MPPQQPYPQAQPPYPPQPQAAWGQPPMQPMQPQQGWGQPGPAPRKGKGGVLVGVLVAVVVLGGGGFAIFKAVGGSTAAPGSYKLSVPQMLALGPDNGWTLKDTKSTPVDPAKAADTGTGITSVQADYTNDADRNTSIAFFGYYGKLKNPAKAMSDYTTQLTAGGGTWTTPLTSYSGGANRDGATLKCGVLDFRIAGAPDTGGQTVCVWSSTSTFGSASYFKAGPQTLTLTPAQAAKTTEQLHDAMVVAK